MRVPPPQRRSPSDNIGALNKAVDCDGKQNNGKQGTAGLPEEDEEEDDEEDDWQAMTVVYLLSLLEQV